MHGRRLWIGFPTLVFLAWTLIGDRSGIGISTLLAALLHECGHILAARALKIPLRRLRIDLLGARLEVSGRLLSFVEEWLLAAAGPLTSLVCAALAFPLWDALPISVPFSCASLLLGILNLLPIKSFDGGRMLEAFLLSFGREGCARQILKGSSFLFLFLLWAIAVYFLLRANDGLSLLCFSMSLLTRFFENE